MRDITDPTADDVTAGNTTEHYERTLNAPICQT